jgi:hypothetical protein
MSVGLYSRQKKKHARRERHISFDAVIYLIRSAYIVPVGLKKKK